MTQASRSRLAIALWLLALALAAWQLSRTRIVADLSGFLPPSATPAQELLLEQMKSGVGSRIVLVALSGAPEERLAAASQALADKLRASGLFGTVQNGDAEGLSADREAFLRHRYLLSPQDDPARFSAKGLRGSLEAALPELGSQSGAPTRALLPRDPTGEMRAIVERLPAASPEKRAGVWFSADGKRALLLAETRAGAFDTAAQQQALALMTSDVKIELAGAGVYAAASRAAIERDAWLTSTVSGALVLLLMLRVYRRARLVALCFVPVASGLLIGIAAVSFAFGHVHGITLAFGATLIGEAVDYPSYACLNAGPGESLRAALARIWPTLRLAVLTTVLGGLTMLLSSFTGLAQLGLLSMGGVLVAGLVTREVVPVLAGAGAVSARGFSLPSWLEAAIGGLRRLTLLAWGLAVGAFAVVFFNSHPWEDDLSALNPIPETLKAADRELRRELGAPDVRHLLIVRAPTREAALEGAEALEPKLAELKKSGAIAGYDLATRYVPSQAEQKRRLAAIPDSSSLKKNLDTALAGLPYRPGAFEPFLKEAEEARRRGPLRDEDLKGTVLGVKVQTLVVPSGREWAVLVPLAGVADASAAAKELPLVDIKSESERLLAGYRAEALRLTALGMGAIVLALALGLRSVRGVARVMLPVLLALLATAAALLLFGQRLTVFHLIAMLLVMGIGLNYALFFDRPEPDIEVRRRTLLALAVNCATTVIAFGTLACSSNPVLKAIGLTVTVGALAALFFSGSLNKRAA